MRLSNAKYTENRIIYIREYNIRYINRTTDYVFAAHIRRPTSRRPTNDTSLFTNHYFRKQAKHDNADNWEYLE